ncbi:MAG: thiamine phosphate synthase [Phycisphaerales bacterium]|nr:thiamine phosphate synthase [Phycisphaerales bacterium]
MNEPSRHHPARILDANANRAREALRVLEDGARFLLDDPEASRGFKELRHALVEVIGSLPSGLLESSRETAGDVGRSIRVDSEFTREDPLAVIRAAAGRLGEALRSIEEWSKTIDPEVAARVEVLRYRSYELTAELAARFPVRGPQWRLCVVLTRALCARSPEEVVRSVVAGGADCIQVREKTLDDRALLAWIEQVVGIARPAGVSVVVNDRVDLALASGADGVHLGADDMPIEAARRLAGGRLWIGATAHDLDEAQAALDAGCDGLGLGTMYPSRTKPDCETRGPGFLSDFLAAHPEVPHLAIGGIDVERTTELSALGCRGVAMSGAICAADEPQEVAREVLEALHGREPMPQ